MANCQDFELDSTLKFGVLDYELEYYQCPHNGTVTPIVSKERFIECMSSSAFNDIVRFIPCQFNVTLELKRAIDNPTNHFDSSTLFGALGKKEIDLVTEVTVTEERFYRFHYQLPYKFFKPVLLLGPQFLVNPTESPFLIFSPFQLSTWLAVAGVVFLILGLSASKYLYSHSTTVRFLFLNLTFIAVLYSSNLRSLLTFPSPIKVPFHSFAQFVDQFVEKDMTLLMDRMEDYRMAIVNSSSAPEFVRLVATFNRSLVYEPNRKVYYEKLTSSKEIVTISQVRPFFYGYKQSTGKDPILLNFQFLDILPIDHLFSSNAVAKHRKGVIEHLSRSSDILLKSSEKLEEEAWERISLQKNSLNQAPFLIGSKHIKLGFFVGIGGLATSLVVFFLELMLAFRENIIINPPDDNSDILY